MLINAAAGDGDVNVEMPVETTAVRMNRAENADIQRTFACGVQQVINRQSAEVVKQPAINLEQRPEQIGEGENQMYPVAVRQAVELRGNPQVVAFLPQEGQALLWQALVMYFIGWQPGLSQPYFFTSVMRVPQSFLSGRGG